MTPTGSNKSSDHFKKTKLSYYAIDVAREEIRDSSSGKTLEISYNTQLLELQDTAKNGVIEEILELELVHLNEELIRFADEKDHVKSLQLGLHQMKTVLDRLDFVRDPEGYQIYDQRHVCHDKNRKDGAPTIDPARQGLVSHITRLKNPIRADLNPEQKIVMSQRADNIQLVLTEFIRLQKVALGPDRKKSQEENMGFS